MMYTRAHQPPQYRPMDQVHELKAPLCMAALCVLLSAILLRVIVVLPAAHRPESRANGADSPLRGNLMILLGSGGHTGEMVRLVENLHVEQCSRTWLVSSGDASSLQKLKALEAKLQDQSENKQVEIAILHRARKVGESVASSIKSTVISLISCVRQLRSLPKADVLLLNGPGTCVPLAYIVFVAKLLGLCSTRIVYVESLARVNRLSLSGRLVLPIANRFIVQWQSLSVQYRRAEYHGILV